MMRLSSVAALAGLLIFTFQNCSGFSGARNQGELTSTGSVQFVPQSVPVLTPAPGNPNNSLDTLSPSVVIPNNAIIPSGTQYVDSVPVTIDLALMAEKYLQAISKTLLPNNPYFLAPPGLVNMHGTPRSIVSGGAPNWGKVAQAMVMARKMSGFDWDNRQGTMDIQLNSMRNMIDPNVNRELIKRNEGAWIAVKGANPENQMTPALEALIELYKQFPDPNLQHLIQEMVDYHSDTAKPYAERGIDMLHWRLPEPGVNVYTFNTVGSTGYADSPFIAGKALRAMASWFNISGDQRALGNGLLVSNFIRHYSNDLFWTFPGDYTENRGEGAFAGHMHMFANALMGMLWEAEALLRNNPSDGRAWEIIEFVKKAYLIIRTSQGGASVALGNFGEICMTADMLRLAVKLTELGADDYNEDIDRWTRNQIAESQIKGAITIAGSGDPLEDRIGEKVIGLFFEDSTHALSIPDVPNGQGNLTLQLVACGLGNVMHAIYDVWEHIVQVQGSVAQVNLLMNRASQYLDVKSELPFKGIVHIVTKSDLGPLKTLAIRLPDSVAHGNVSVAKNGVFGVSFTSHGTYIHITGLQPNTTYSVQFPQVYMQANIRQVRNQNQNWTESNYAVLSPTGTPDVGFHPYSPENVFLGTFKSNTLIDVDHRPAGGIALYSGDDRKQWAAFGAGDAPGGATYHNVYRFVHTPGSHGRVVAGTAPPFTHPPYAPQPPPRKLKLMAMGDSITYGIGSSNCGDGSGCGGYRAYLDYYLEQRGIPHDFVGTQANGLFPENQHEGYPSQKIDHLMNRINLANIMSVQPDIVLLHIGTNDIVQDYDIEHAPDRLSGLIYMIAQASPGSNIAVAGIIPMYNSYDGWDVKIRAYNERVRAVVNYHQTVLGQHVHFVDMHAVIDQSAGSNHFADPVHPSDNGYHEMAKLWLEWVMRLK